MRQIREFLDSWLIRLLRAPAEPVVDRPKLRREERDGFAVYVVDDQG